MSDDLVEKIMQAIKMRDDYVDLLIARTLSDVRRQALEEAANVAEERLGSYAEKNIPAAIRALIPE